MASFKKYATKNGEFWMFKMDVGKDPVTGSRKSTTRRGFKRKSDAEKAAAKMLRDLMSGEMKKEDITFEEVFNEWFDKHKRQIKPSTLYTKESKFRKHILPNFAKLKMRKITPEYCQNFVDNLAAQLASYRDYVIQTNLVFRYAVKHDYLSKNPMDKVENPLDEDHYLAKEDVDIRFWEKETFNYVIARAEEELSFKQYAMIRGLLYLGLRKGELLALVEEDLLPETREVDINKTLFWQKGKMFVLMKPKTKNSVRRLEADEETFLMLQKLARMNKELRMRHGNPDVQKFLFPRDDLRPMRLAHPNDLLLSVSKRFGVEYIGVHGLRHTYASMLFASGASMKEVQMKLGHSKIETTMNLYTHVTKERKAEVVKNFVDYLAK